MTRTEHLLVILMEECSEVAQRASKALRFGLHEVEPGQRLTNAERINLEYMDLVTVMEMLVTDKAIAYIFSDQRAKLISDKFTKIEKFLAYSKECGTLQD